MSSHACIHFRASGVKGRACMNVVLRPREPVVAFHKPKTFELSGQLKGLPTDFRVFELVELVTALLRGPNFELTIILN
jgi:hypothetical protein